MCAVVWWDVLQLKFLLLQRVLLARPRSVQTKVYCNHLCCWLGLEARFLAAGQRHRFSYAGGSWLQAISSACNERIAAFQRPIAGATPPEPRNLKKTMKQQQQPTEPSANELRAIMLQCGVQGGGGGEWRLRPCATLKPPTEVCLICIIGVVIVNDVLAFCAARRGGIMV